MKFITIILVQLGKISSIIHTSLNVFDYFDLFHYFLQYFFQILIKIKIEKNRIYKHQFFFSRPNV